jgi:hypothetical protein
MRKDSGDVETARTFHVLNHNVSTAERAQGRGGVDHEK